MKISKDFTELLKKSFRHIGNDISAQRPATLTDQTNISFLKTIELDKTVVNQCQGFTFDPTVRRFILGCCNPDNSKQRIYELNMDMSVYRTTDFEGVDKLGHVNTLFMDEGVIRATNGAANGNRIYSITRNDSGELQLGEFKDYPQKCFNICKDLDGSGRYVSIVPGESFTTRKIRIYDDETLSKHTEYIVQVDETNNDSNGAYFKGDTIIFAVTRRLIECRLIGKEFKVIREIEMEPYCEIEDFVYVDGDIYMAANSHDYVRIYKYSSKRSYYNHINNDYLNNGITVGNMVGYHGKTADGSTNLVIAKVNKNSNLEIGDKRASTIVIGKELKHWDGGNASYTVLTTKHYDVAVYKKATVDEKLKAITDRITALENK